MVDDKENEGYLAVRKLLKTMGKDDSYAEAAVHYSFSIAEIIDENIFIDNAAYKGDNCMATLASLIVAIWAVERWAKEQNMKQVPMQSIISTLYAVLPTSIDMTINEAYNRMDCYAPKESNN